MNQWHTPPDKKETRSITLPGGDSALVTMPHWYWYNADAISAEGLDTIEDMAAFWWPHCAASTNKVDCLAYYLETQIAEIVAMNEWAEGKLKTVFNI